MQYDDYFLFVSADDSQCMYIKQRGEQGEYTRVLSVYEERVRPFGKLNI
jgi:hypothetical protein